jgi:hypothetical protein
MSTTPFAAAAAAMMKSLKSVAGTAVIYSRAVRMTAVPARTQADVAMNVQDFQIRKPAQRLDDRRVATWCLSEQLATPLAGDRITVVGDGKVYEVMHERSGVPPWRWSDQSGQQYRVHTKDVSAPRSHVAPPRMASRIATAAEAVKARLNAAPAGTFARRSQPSASTCRRRRW